MARKEDVKKEGGKEEVVSKTEETKEVGGALAPAASTAVAMPAIDFYADAGAGMEEADKDSFAIPFLSALQGLSKQIETVDGAKPGLLINTVTNELMKSALFVPVAFQRRYLRWVPRNKGGGFKGQMMVSEVDALVAAGDAARDESDEGRGRLMFEGDELKDTRIHFGLLLKEEGGWQKVIISMAGTQVKRSKRFMAQIGNIQIKAPNGAMITPPSFSHTYLVTTEKEQNDKGTWYSFNFDLKERVSDPALYAAAKDFYAQIVSGKVVVQPPADDEHDAEDSGKF